MLPLSVVCLTLLSDFICNAQGQQTPIYSSCKHAQETGCPASLYRINARTDLGYTEVVCHDSPADGCSGPGWTPVLKVLTSPTEYRYTSQYWRNKRDFQSDSGDEIFPSYWSTSFIEICLAWSSGKGIVLPLSGNSLYSLIASGRKIATNLTIAAWKNSSALFTFATFEPNCFEQGINVGSEEFLQARIGIVSTNATSACSGFKHAIGIAIHDPSRGLYTASGVSDGKNFALLALSIYVR